MANAKENGRRITKRNFANTMGISDQNFANKFRRNTFTLSEVVYSLDSLDFDVIVRDRKNGDEYNMLTGEYKDTDFEPSPAKENLDSSDLFALAKKLGLTVVLKDKDGSEIAVKN